MNVFQTFQFFFLFAFSVILDKKEGMGELMFLVGDEKFV